MRSDPGWVRAAVARRFTRLAYYCLSELNLTAARANARTALSYAPFKARAWAIVAASLLPAAALRLGRQVRTWAR
jgi:Tfp pilus assembly protein PilF